MSAIQIYTELDGEFHDLIIFLCHTSSIRRPVAVSDPVEVYAGSLVKLHQYCVISTDNVCFKKFIRMGKFLLLLFAVGINAFSDS